MSRLLKVEPVMVVAVIVAVVNLAVSLGVLEANSAETIVALAESLVVLVLGLAARSAVTPVRK